jgi:hypothetical protein
MQVDLRTYGVILLMLIPSFLYTYNTFFHFPFSLPSSCSSIHLFLASGGIWLSCGPHTSHLLAGTVDTLQRRVETKRRIMTESPESRSSPPLPPAISHWLNRGENAQVMSLSAKPENSSSDRFGASRPIRKQHCLLAVYLLPPVFIFQRIKSEKCTLSCLKETAVVELRKQIRDNSGKSSLELSAKY